MLLFNLTLTTAALVVYTTDQSVFYFTSRWLTMQQDSLQEPRTETVSPQYYPLFTGYKLSAGFI